MGLDLIMYPIDPISWDRGHVYLRTQICCERSSELFFQLDLWGEPPDDPDDLEKIPYPVVSPLPVPADKIFHREVFREDGKGTYGIKESSDRIGESDNEPNFIYTSAEQFNKIHVHIIEHDISRAAVVFMQRLPGNWKVLLWRA